MSNSRRNTQPSKKIQAAKAGAEYFTTVALALSIGFDALGACLPIALIIKYPVTYVTGFLCGFYGGCNTYRRLEKEEGQISEEKKIDDIFRDVEEIKETLHQGPAYQSMEEMPRRPLVCHRTNFFSDTLSERKHELLDDEHDDVFEEIVFRGKQRQYG